MRVDLPVAHPLERLKEQVSNKNKLLRVGKKSNRYGIQYAILVQSWLAESSEMSTELGHRMAVPSRRKQWSRP